MLTYADLEVYDSISQQCILALAQLYYCFTTALLLLYYCFTAGVRSHLGAVHSGAGAARAAGEDALFGRMLGWRYHYVRYTGATAALLLLYYCFTAALLLLYYCFTAALLRVALPLCQ